MAEIRLILCFMVFSAVGICVITSFTDPGDAAVLLLLKNEWQNTPPSWGNSSDPCGPASPWAGVICQNANVIILSLSSMGLVGQLPGEIGALANLTSLDLSFNKGITGSLSPRLVDLKKLVILNLMGCGLSGVIPYELGNFAKLIHLSLNSNNFTGEIPASLGNLSKLHMLDLAGNRLSGSLPVSSSTSPGLDLLKYTEQIYLMDNQLSGEIPAQLFSADMKLLRVLFEGNKFTGKIPHTLGLVRTLEVIRLGGNALTSFDPSSLDKLTNLKELNLANNELTSIPDLSGLRSVDYVDLSNNPFLPSEAPAWFSTLGSLSTLYLENGSLQGPVPRKLFNLPRLQHVMLRNNTFNGTLDVTGVFNQSRLVELQNNNISALTLSPSGYNNTIWLMGNPICNGPLKDTKFCHI